MKRFTLFMAAIICLATSALAQISENQTLSTTLWKQGIATCAHYTAHARGFGKKIDEIKSQYPQGYTLDDLNEVYNNQGRKWEKIYNEFKEEEDKNGSISDLKELVTPQIWKLVEPEFQAFITDHPVEISPLTNTSHSSLVAPSVLLTRSSNCVTVIDSTMLSRTPN